MPAVTINVPAEGSDALAKNYTYQAQIPNPVQDPGTPGTEMIANPETKPQFAKRMIVNFVKDNIRAYRRSVGIEALVIDNTEPDVT